MPSTSWSWSALQWEDWDEAAGILRVRRKQVDGTVGALTRRKPGPGVCPVGPELAAVLRAHRRALLRQQTPGLAAGWMIPAPSGKLRSRAPLDQAWRRDPASQPTTRPGILAPP